MVSRKSHPKSRNGCANCKKRRIKCDEQKPRCGNCDKHAISCDFSTHTSHSSHTSQNVSTSSRHEYRHCGSNPSLEKDSSTDRSPALQRSQKSLFNGPRSQLPDLQMAELELLHHFTTETCYTLSDRAESHELWRITAPEVAFQHDFLMRGILAISALHLSCLRLEKQNHWAHVARKQQDAALSSFRSIMTKMDESNCDAFLALSSLIVVYGFESPKNAGSLGMFDYHGQDSDEWLPLIRGVNSIIMSVYPWIKNGRLSGLLHDHIQQPPQTELPNVLNEQLTNLEGLCKKASGGPDAVEAYKTALERLKMSFVRMNNRPPYECEISIAFLWPVMIPQEYISMLNERRPEALVILAHYCVILHHLDDYWWMRGWALHIIENIRRKLDDDWQRWLQWPTNVVTVDQKILTDGTLQNPISGNRVSSNFHTSIDESLNVPDDQLRNS